MSHIGTLVVTANVTVVTVPARECRTRFWHPPVQDANNHNHAQRSRAMDLHLLPPLNNQVCRRQHPMAGIHIRYSGTRGAQVKGRLFACVPLLDTFDHCLVSM
jgi:hypothetical protein